MKIVVTGASGNIGSKLMKALQEEYPASVTGLSRTDHEGLVVTDYSVESLKDIFTGCDLVVHLASKRGAADDYRSFIENEITTENILKAMLLAGAGRIIFMSSIAVYSDKALLPWKEDQYPTPQTFYGISKLTCEHLCKHYAKRGIDYTILRCGIVYGIDDTKRMISVFIRKANAKERIMLKGKSAAKRDFIYVKDVVSALLWSIFEDTQKNRIYNLGGGEAITNLEVARTVNDCFDNAENLLYDDSVEETVINSYMDSSRINQAGFHQSYTFASALKDIREDLSPA